MTKLATYIRHRARLCSKSNVNTAIANTPRAEANRIGFVAPQHNSPTKLPFSLNAQSNTMTVTQIIRFHAHSASEADDQANAAVKALKGAKAPENYVLGTQIQDKRNLQLSSEWHDPKAESSKEAEAYRETVIKSLGNPEKMFHVSFKDGQSAFDNGGPLSSPLVEFVQIYFPTDKVTKEFRDKIEKDFKKFDDICTPAAKGNGAVTYGWVLEEQEHKDVKKSKCFFVARGWEGMQYFEDVIKTDEYKEAVKILMGWQAPWDMWHVKREF